MRTRRQAPRWALTALRPLFRLSYTRSRITRRAYVLRLVGGRVGPVLVERDAKGKR
jgi:hypothetical protein